MFCLSTSWYSAIVAGLERVNVHPVLPCALGI